VALERIASLGFRAVDIGISPRYCPHIDPWKWTPGDTDKLLDQLRSLGLRVSSLNVVPAGLAARYPEEVEEFIEATFPIGKALNVNTITIQPGPPVDVGGLGGRSTEGRSKVQTISGRRRDCGGSAFD